MGKAIIKCIIFLAFVVFLIFNFLDSARTEEVFVENKDLIVIADTLNGRYRPTKKSAVLAEYEFGDILKPTGKWSKDHAWIQVYHPEEKYVWVSINYISERMDIFEVYTLCDSPVKVRKYPESGKVTKYLKKEQHVEVDQVILGYGHTSYGWIDLSYFIEEESSYETPHPVTKR